MAKPKKYYEYEEKIINEIQKYNHPYTYVGCVHFKTKKDSIIKFKCNIHSTEFTSSIDNFIWKKSRKGTGCLECAKIKSTLSKLRSTEEEIEYCKYIHGDKYSYENFIWNGVRTNSTYTCTIHNISFIKTPANFRKTDRIHCPECSGNLNLNDKQCDLYVQIVVCNGVKFGKFGISTNTHRRMIQQRSQSNAEHTVLLVRTFNTRAEAIKLEKYLKENILCSYVGKDILPDGFTETFSEEYLETVLNIVNNFK